MLSPKVPGTHVRCVCGSGRPSDDGRSRGSVHTGQAGLNLTRPSCACVCAQPDDDTPAPMDPTCQVSCRLPAAEPTFSFILKKGESIHLLAAWLTGSCFLSIHTCNSKQMIMQLDTAATAVL